MAKKQFGSIKVLRCIAVLFIIICGVFMLSCGASITDPSKIGPAKTLWENDLALDQEHGFTALMVWSLRIKDQTGQLKGMKPKFSIGPVGATEKMKKGRGKIYYRYSIHTPAMETSNKERMTQLYPSLALAMNFMASECSFIIPVCSGQ